MMNFKTVLLYLFFGSSVIRFSQSQNNGNTNIDSNKEQNGILPQKSIDSIGFPVDPFNDTLFFVYNRIGVFTAENRAQAITKRIETLSKDPYFKKDSLGISKSDYGFEIVYNGDFVVMTVTDSDGKKMGNTDFELAQKNLAIIQKAVLFQKKNNLTANWMKPLGIVVLIIVGVFVIVIALKKRFKKL